jgi:hypothetical protein
MVIVPDVDVVVDDDGDDHFGWNDVPTAIKRIQEKLILYPSCILHIVTRTYLYLITTNVTSVSPTRFLSLYCYRLGHFEFKSQSFTFNLLYYQYKTFTMRFSLIAPTIAFQNEQKYSVNVGDDNNDQTTIKIPVFENGPPEAVLKWRKQFDELCDLKQLTAGQNFTNILFLLLTGEAKEHWIDSRESTAPEEEDNHLNAAHFIEATATDLRDYLHYIKKPNNMTVESFIRLPPPLNDSLTDDQLFSIIKKSVPSWSNNFRTANLRNQITTPFRN